MHALLGIDLGTTGVKAVCWLLGISVLKIGASKDNINISPDKPWPERFFQIDLTHGSVIFRSV